MNTSAQFTVVRRMLVVYTRLFNKHTKNFPAGSLECYVSKRQFKTPNAVLLNVMEIAVCPRPTVITINPLCELPKLDYREKRVFFL